MRRYSTTRATVKGETAIKGEGRTDDEALAIIDQRILELGL